MSWIIEYKDNFLIKYCLDSPFALKTSKIRLGILLTSFLSWTEGIFSMHQKLYFWVQNCRLLSSFFINLWNKQSPQLFNRIEVWRAHWKIKSFIFCSSKYFFVIDTLWITALSCWNLKNFCWSLSDSMPPQVCETLEIILTDHNTAVVWFCFLV